MATDTSSIDDMLLSGGIQTPSHPEPSGHDDSYDEPENGAIKDNDSTPVLSDNVEYEEQEGDESDTEKQDVDDYGNEKPAPRTYTEDEVNERINKAIRERLARGNNQQVQQPAAQQQVQQQVASQFEYNPESGDNWQQQLEQFVEQTIDRRTHRQLSQQQQQREQEADNQFRDKFTQGMTKFTDFYEVVSAQPVNEAMTLALRSVNDPAAFIYAASKRHPAELQRISNLGDPYAQIAEMGKLEERMKKNAQGTKAPRPIGKSTEDSPIKFKVKNKETSIEDLIAHSEAKKMEKLKARRGR